MRTKNMTERDGGTTGFFVRLSVNILDLFNTDNVKYTQISKTLRSILPYYKQPLTVKPVCLSTILPNTYPQYFIELTSLHPGHYVLAQHVCPCRGSEPASTPKRLWRCLTWKAYSLQKEIQADGLFVLLPKGLLCKPGGEWCLKQRQRERHGTESECQNTSAAIDRAKKYHFKQLFKAVKCFFKRSFQDKREILS